MNNHFLVGLCMRLGIFAPICAFGALAAMPPIFWDSFIFPLLKSRSKARSLVIFYNSNKSIIHWTVQVFRQFFISDELLKIQPINDQPDVEISEKKYSQTPVITVVESDTRQINSNYMAILSLVHISPLIWPLYYIMRMRLCRSLGDFIFSHSFFVIESNRNSKVKNQSSVLSLFAIYVWKVVKNLFCIWAIVCCFTW